MKVLLTGSSGFIGQYLLEALKREPDIQEIATLNKHYHHNQQGVKTYSCMLGAASAMGTLDRVFSQFQPDIIFHLAGNPRTKMDDNHPLDQLYVNTAGTQQLVHSAPKGCRFINTSTVLCYGDYLKNNGRFYPDRYRETSRTYPTSMYATSKLATEHIVNVYTNRLEHINGVNLRLCATIGKNANHGIIKDFIHKLLSGSKNLECLGSYPGSTKPFTHVEDVVSAFLLMMRKSAHGSFNVTPNDELNVEEVAQIVMDAMNIYKPVRFLGEQSTWPEDVKVLKVNSDAIRALGWQPECQTSQEAIYKAVKGKKNE